MIEGRLLREPVLAPPGPLEMAVGLLVAQVCWPRPQTRSVLLHWLLGEAERPGVAPPSLTRAVELQGVGRHHVSLVRARLQAMGRRVGPPASLRYALAIAGSAPVAPASWVAKAVAAGGHTEREVHPESLLRAAEVFGAAGSFRVERFGLGCLVVPEGLPDPSVAVMAAARAGTRRPLFASIGDVADVAGVLPVVARMVLQADPAWHVCVAGERVWRIQPVAGGRDGVAGTIHRVLRLGPLSIGDAHDGCARLLARTHRGLLPSVDVLGAYVVSQPTMFVRGDLVGLRRVLPPGSLSRRVCSDRALQRAFAVRGAPVLKYRELADALVAAGFAASGSGALVTGSPAVRRVGRDRYVLRAGAITASVE